MFLSFFLHAPRSVFSLSLSHSLRKAYVRGRLSRRRRRRGVRIIRTVSADTGSDDTDGKKTRERPGAVTGERAGTRHVPTGTRRVRGELLPSASTGRNAARFRRAEFRRPDRRNTTILSPAGCAAIPGFPRRRHALTRGYSPRLISDNVSVRAAGGRTARAIANRNIKAAAATG